VSDKVTTIPTFSTTKALVVAPRGRDAAVASALLRQAGIASELCVDIVALKDAVNEEAAFAVITEEALRFADLRLISARLQAQPAWSDFPFVVLTRREGNVERNTDAIRFSEALGNVTFLERPFHPTTFISVARSALKTRQRQYEARARIEELHEGEERLRTALLAGRLGTWEFDLTTSTLEASPAFRALFGRTAEQSFDYADLVGCIHQEDRARMQEGVLETIEAGDDYAADYRILWPDGSMHWAEIRARRVRDSRSQNPRLVGVSLDITDRKVSEQALRRLNETLEERVTERTSELRVAHAAVLSEIEHRERTEQQLRQAQKMEAIGQLTGGVAHDFNNLLMAVLSNLELLRKRVPDEPKTARLISGALQGAKRGAALTQRLLAFARRQDLNVEPSNLIDLVLGMTDLIERSIGSQIELRIDLPNTLPLALVDANQIELAVLNLVLNSRDAMADGGTLRIKADQMESRERSEIPDGKYIRLVVADTGHGMDAETLRKATDPFFSTKEIGKGTGLGLSMVQGLAVQLNGMLRLESALGHGTIAELWLPATTLAPEEKASKFDEVVRLPARKMTVLVVDDDVLVAMSTVDMLEDLGFKVIEARSGTDALEIVKNDKAIDLLITDYSMPRMNGAQLARAVKEVRPELPILLATGYAELPPHSALDLPRIGKPYRQDQLEAEISKLFK
jgi:PAS domain S-box-containing protein